MRSNLHEIIALPLTPRTPAAIAVILLAGRAIPRLLQKLAANPRARTLPVGQFCRSNLLDTSTPPNPIDDALIVHTAPDRFELHLHGGPAVIDAVLSALQSLGATILTPDQALTQNLLGPTLKAELQLTLPLASTTTALRLLLAQPHALITWSHHWQSWLSAPGRTPQDLWQFHSAAQWLLTRSRTLMHLLHPARIAILGPPNAGKSTLANALLGRPISITSHIAGTTRDWVDAQATFTAPDPSIPSQTIDVAVTLIDTAGIRETHDPLEYESIRRAHIQAHSADALIILFDASQTPSPADLALIHTYNTFPKIIALNKSDLAPTAPPQFSAFFPLIPISAKTCAGLDQLMSALLCQLDLTSNSTEPFPFTPRQHQIFLEISQSDSPAQCHHVLQLLINSPGTLESG